MKKWNVSLWALAVLIAAACGNKTNDVPAGAQNGWTSDKIRDIIGCKPNNANEEAICKCLNEAVVKKYTPDQIAQAKTDYQNNKPSPVVSDMNSIALACVTPNTPSPTPNTTTPNTPTPGPGVMPMPPGVDNGGIPVPTPGHDMPPTNPFGDLPNMPNMPNFMGMGGTGDIAPGDNFGHNISNSEEYSYEIKLNGKTTGKHTFNSLAALCEALQSDSLNGNHSEEFFIKARRDYFTAHNCPGQFVRRP